jgi:multidrug efflux pump subunit AcrB
MGDLAGYRDVQAAVNSVDLGMNSSSRVFPHAKDYDRGVTLDVVVMELFRNITLAMVCVFICTLFLIANIITTLIVCLTVSITLMDVAGNFFQSSFMSGCMYKILRAP